MQRRTTAVPLALACLTALVATGCTDQDETPTSDPTPATAGSAPSTRGTGFDPEDRTVTVKEPAFTVETSAQRQATCYDAGSADIASIDYSWKAATDVTVTDVELVDARGVRLVGAAQTVPPVNRGGEIPLGGEFTWGKPHPTAGSRFVFWGERERVDFHTFSAGETGLFVLHLRYSPGRGSSAGLRVSYTVDGEDTAPGPYTAEVGNELRWQVVTGKEKCSF